MSLHCIIIPSVEVPHFGGTNIVSWKSQMSSYLHEMNPQVWWMVDVGISHAIENFPQTQGQKKCLYLKAHTSNVLSSALSAEIKDNIEIEYDLFERANLLRLLSKCLAQAMIRDHHQQIYQRMSHHHQYTLIKIKKNNQVFKKKK
jgi:hypothetical protein